MWRSYFAVVTSSFVREVARVVRSALGVLKDTFADWRGEEIGGRRWEGRGEVQSCCRGMRAQTSQPMTRKDWTVSYYQEPKNAICKVRHFHSPMVWHGCNLSVVLRNSYFFIGWCSRYASHVGMHVMRLFFPKPHSANKKKSLICKPRQFVRAVLSKKKMAFSPTKIIFLVH